MARARVPMHPSDLDLAAAERALAAIRAGSDAELVEVMAKAAFEGWQALMRAPRPWAEADLSDADVTRLGVHAALLAARQHARARRKP